MHPMLPSAKKTATTMVFLLFLAVPCMAQKTRVAISPRSNVSSAAIGKAMDSRCPNVGITLDAQKATFFLEAIDSYAGKARKPYKFALFNSDGDRVFSTETAGLNNAVKDVCRFISKKAAELKK